MGLRLSLIVALALTLGACGSEEPADGGPAQAPAVAVASGAAPGAVPAPPPAKPQKPKPNCGASQTALKIADGWQCAFNPWQGLKAGSAHEKCDGNAPACTNEQKPACGPGRKWFCHENRDS